MKPGDFDQVAELFHAVLDAAPDQRAAVLATRAADNPALREQVQKLLEADAAEQRTGFIDALFDDAPPPQPAPLTLGQQIGTYKLLRELGRGGTGIVYEAEETTSGRHVALKLLHAAPSSPHAQTFLQEAKVLARLDHPGIASVHTAGYTESGQPYFVMELVEGQRLDKYARRHPRGARLQLFLRICEAVDYAHRQGVIHRDLKPSNVLVRNLAGLGGEPGNAIVKIVDFGLAKLADHPGAMTTFTLGAGGWGTLPYMSPEQRRGGVVDYRTDVYALGVILFKLMTDELPHPVENLPLPEAWYKIEHERPRKPSQIDPLLRGDLETIILNALAEEPAQRYLSAAELGTDVQRYLSDQRPLRRAPGAFRELGRFAKRNRGLAATLLGILLGLAATTAGTGVGLMRASRIEADARSLAEQKSNIADLILAEAGSPRRGLVVRNANPITGPTDNLRKLGDPRDVVAALADLLKLAEVSLPADHVYVAVLRGALGEVHLSRGDYHLAEPLLKSSYESIRTTLGPTDPHTRVAIQRLVRLYESSGRQEKATEWRGRLAALDRATGRNGQ